jgi:hypothetical protein
LAARHPAAASLTIGWWCWVRRLTLLLLLLLLLLLRLLRLASA